MFLEATIKRNPELIEAAIYLHQTGKIKPNTYVLDIDNILENARNIKKAADDNGINLYMMTKQIGRNPEVAKLIAKEGIEKAVAVDPWEAITLGSNNIRIGHVGHLVQIPSNMIERILSLSPEVITVFSVEKAREISMVAEKQGRVQDILLRVVDDKDLIYEGQGGGFSLKDLQTTVKEIKKLKGVKIAGVTAFPCFLYSQEEKRIVKTPNADTLIKGANILRKDLRIKINHINAPSANSVASMPLVKEIGATHAEPGHALTGTMPINAEIEQVEVPSMVYVSEISHLFHGKAYVYFGGYYRRGHLKEGLVGTTLQKALNNRIPAKELSPTNIDYYGELDVDNREVKVGDTAIYAFRTQIFVTRADVALVKGIKTGNIELVGIYDSQGNKR